MDRGHFRALNPESLMEWVDKTQMCVENRTKGCSEEITKYVTEQLELQEKGLRIELEHCFYRGKGKGHNCHKMLN